MRAVDKATLEFGTIELERYDETGLLRPAPIYKFTSDSGLVSYMYDWSRFQIIVE